jgi:hypothetical protein
MFRSIPILRGLQEMRAVQVFFLSGKPQPVQGSSSCCQTTVVTDSFPLVLSLSTLRLPSLPTTIQRRFLSDPPPGRPFRGAPAWASFLGQPSHPSSASLVSPPRRSSAARHPSPLSAFNHRELSALPQQRLLRPLVRKKRRSIRCWSDRLSRMKIVSLVVDRSMGDRKEELGERYEGRESRPCLLEEALSYEGSNLRLGIPIELGSKAKRWRSPNERSSVFACLSLSSRTYQLQFQSAASTVLTSLFLSFLSPFPPAPHLRINPVGIQLLSPRLHPQVFPSNAQNPPRTPKPEDIATSKEHLQSNGLFKESPPIIDPIDFDLPKLKGDSIDEHFHTIGVQVSRHLLQKLAEEASSVLSQKWRDREQALQHRCGEVDPSVAEPGSFPSLYTSSFSNPNPTSPSPKPTLPLPPPISRPSSLMRPAGPNTPKTARPSPSLTRKARQCSPSTSRSSTRSTPTPSWLPPALQTPGTFGSHLGSPANRLSKNTSSRSVLPTSLESSSATTSATTGARSSRSIISTGRRTGSSIRSPSMRRLRA